MRWYPAPGKLNLFLHVVGRRADGYHELQTVFRLLDHGDRLRIRVRDDAQIVRVNEVPGVPAAEDLCVRAAHLLQRHTGCRLGTEIELDKVLPMGGGLGGGSSDAATTLIVLNRLWGLQLPGVELRALAVQLGADVPVFVFGENAFAEGVGEHLTAITLAPAWYVVLVPPIAVSTARIFADLQLTRNTNRIKMSAFFAGAVGNDLEEVACRHFPVLRNYLDWLKQHAPAQMTGSGACVFASFAEEHLARGVFASRPPYMKGFVAQGLEHHPLRDMIFGE